MGSSRTSESYSESGSGQRHLRNDVRRGIANVEAWTGNYRPYTDRAVAATEGLGRTMGAQYDSGSALSAQGQQYQSDVLSGRYLGQGNPYVEGMIGQMRRGVTDTTNSQFSLNGRYGSGAHVGALTQGLADGENQLRFNDYNQERARMDAAAGQAAGQNIAQGQLALGAQNQNMTAPYAGMSAYASSLGNLFNGGTQRSVTYGPNPIWGAIGAGLGALGSAASAGAFSDRRLKKDIVEIRRRSDGLTVYQWTYRNDPEQRRYEGFMADQVAEIYPDAHIANYNGTGYSGVNYAAIPPEKVAA